MSNNEAGTDILSSVMIGIHGPLLAGETLSKTLGYSSNEALRQAASRNNLPITLMNLPGRRLKFGLSSEVAEWLIQQRITNCTLPLKLDENILKPPIDSLKLFILENGYLLNESSMIDLWKLTNKEELSSLPFGLFRVDNRQTKLFALSVEAFPFLK